MQAGTTTCSLFEMQALLTFVCLGWPQTKILLIFASQEARIKAGAGGSSCNPTYSGGKDQEDHGSKPALANSSRDTILKKPITEKGWWSGSS
jgi:hypothetical protein